MLYEVVFIKQLQKKEKGVVTLVFTNQPLPKEKTRPLLMMFVARVVIVNVSSLFEYLYQAVKYVVL